MTWRIVTILSMIIGCFGSSLAQHELVAEARKFYQEKSYEEAQRTIDLAMEHPELEKDAYAWLIRGYIYKDVYKKVESGDRESKAREGALEFAMKAMELDTTKDQVFFSDGYKLYDHISKTFYNDAARAMNQMDHENATRFFEQFTTTVLRLSPDADLDQKRVDFKNALATVYTKLYNDNREDLAYFKLAMTTYQDVLYVDKENYGANYNMATMWYNRGVYEIQKITPENDIPSIERIQAVAKEFFMEALPFMLKAHGHDPGRCEVLKGLEGIYYSLQEHRLSDEYRDKYDDTCGGQE